LDLGVIRPGTNSFLLGIECDGAMYYGCPVARDRDRLRATVLGGLGWDLYRVWGAAWYRDRAEEENRLRDALKRAELPTRRPAPLYTPTVSVKVAY
jgi:very-short-patch-repair endonuclease